MSPKLLITLALPLVVLAGCGWCKKRSCCTHDEGSRQTEQMVMPQKETRESGPMQGNADWADEEEETDK